MIEIRFQIGRFGGAFSLYLIDIVILIGDAGVLGGIDRLMSHIISALQDEAIAKGSLSVSASFRASSLSAMSAAIYELYEGCRF